MASSSDHTNITIGLSISVRDHQVWDYDGSDFVSFFTDSDSLKGMLVTIDGKTYKLIKYQKYNTSFRWIGVAVK